jgi:peptidoglycan/xylan/chitin deacetylase (PgdA/CDA1 family)
VTRGTVQLRKGRALMQAAVVGMALAFVGTYAASKTPISPQKTGAAALKNVKGPLLWVLPGEAINRWQGGHLVSLWRGEKSQREVALTFDDGPHPAFTARLLDLLKREHVKATFFLVGKKVDEAPAMVARIVREGHEVGNHTYHHLNLDKLTTEQAEAEIRQANESIYRACGVKPVSFRPPGGHHSEVVYQAAAKQTMRTIFWTDDPGDFNRPAPDVILARTLKDLDNGSDILLHDGIEPTLQMLPDLIARLRRDGYRFVTISEMAQHLETVHRGQRTVTH